MRQNTTLGDKIILDQKIENEKPNITKKSLKHKEFFNTPVIKITYERFSKSYKSSYGEQEIYIVGNLFDIYFKTFNPKNSSTLSFVREMKFSILKRVQIHKYEHIFLKDVPDITTSLKNFYNDTREKEKTEEDMFYLFNTSLKDRQKKMKYYLKNFPSTQSMFTVVKQHLKLSLDKNSYLDFSARKFTDFVPTDFDGYAKEFSSEYIQILFKSISTKEIPQRVFNELKSQQMVTTY